MCNGHLPERASDLKATAQANLVYLQRRDRSEDCSARSVRTKMDLILCTEPPTSVSSPRVTLL